MLLIGLMLFAFNHSFVEDELSLISTFFMNPKLKLEQPLVLFSTPTTFSCFSQFSIIGILT
jgi:hypothetical protein